MFAAVVEQLLQARLHDVGEGDVIGDQQVGVDRARGQEMK